MQIKEAAALLDVTADILRNWEKNGLIRVPRAPGNGYRVYGPEEIDRLYVIRLLFRAGYGASALLRALNHLDAGRSADPDRSWIRRRRMRRSSTPRTVGSRPWPSRKNGRRRSSRKWGRCAANSFDTMNHFMLINQMLLVGSTYWNMGYGWEAGEASGDEEGMQDMRNLGENMAWLLGRNTGN